jgi:restriction system protein
MAIWLVRAGKQGQREGYALDNGCAVIGWSECPDFSSLSGREDLLPLLEAVYPDCGHKRLLNWESQLWPFISTIQKGDIIALPLKTRSTVAFGRVTGDYRYDASAPHDANHQRPVEWLKEVPRSEIGQDLLYSMGAFMTVCRIQRNDAESRIKALLEGKADAPKRIVISAEADEESAPIDLEVSIRDQIRSAIMAKFKGHKLSNLVAAVLEAQGFQTEVAGDGPDGGVDIFAGKGQLGFDSPKMVVQVKSEQSPIDVMAVRQLQGVMHQYDADHGLFVAWGGFKSTVLKEFARHHFQLRLWSGEELLDFVLEHYDVLGPEIHADLPLKRVWMLSLADE